MKISINDVKNDLIQLCEDNDIMKKEIETYFEEFDNINDKILDLKDEVKK